jgi:hypothetical protein
MTSVSSQSASSISRTDSGAGAGPNSSHLSHSVLAEVHHSSEVLRQKIDKIENQREELTPNQSPSRRNRSGPFEYDSQTLGQVSQDNAVYVPEVEYTEEHSRVEPNQMNCISSPIPENVPNNRPNFIVPNLSNVGVHRFSPPNSSNSNPNA